MKEENCEHGHNGQCCCNCQHQITLRKHPFNKDFGKGSITETCGFVCLNPEINGNESGIFSDNIHGCCECYQAKNYAKQG